MKNLRLIGVEIVSNTEIKARFTEKLALSIDTSNVSIVSQTPGVDNPGVLSVSVVDDILTINSYPLTPSAAFFLTFNSTSDSKFKSLNGDALLFEDGITNRYLIIGPVENDNVIKTNINNYLRDSIYNTDNTSVISKYIDSLAINLSKGLYDIRQVKNENYLSVEIKDEKKTRGRGPFDRLSEEGAYEIIRVGKQLTGTKLSKTLSFDDFPIDPITLQGIDYSEDLKTASENKNGFFNLKTFVLSLNKKFITKVNSIVFNYTDKSPYTYDIEKYGYQLLESKYDSQYAFTYLLLKNNQVKISDLILNDTNFSLENIFNISVKYQYKDTSISIDPTTIEVSTVLSSGRETLPPLKNIFNLKHAPITKANGKIGSVGDVVFYNLSAPPNSNVKHPAFLYEIPYRVDYLPSRVGEYAIDYETGTVYVYGESQEMSGTGATPPVIVYNYKYSFKEDIDYVYDESLLELVSLPNGNLKEISADISFSFENVLAKDIDYIANIHKEALNERIGNNLIALNALKAQNSPITNVFRIYNETSGELYKFVRFNNDKIYFSYNIPPNIQSLVRERASFDYVSNETLFINTIITTVDPNIKIFKILLNNNNIVGSSEDGLGFSENSTVNFSDLNIFVNELYFDNFISETDNLTRLNQVGYYQVDYKNGVIYCAVDINQDFNIGSVSYKRSYINTQYPHILSVEDLYYQFSSISQKEKTFAYSDIFDGSAYVENLEYLNERFLNNDQLYPYVLLNNKIGSFDNSEFVPGVSNNVKYIRGLYELNDLYNNIQPINFANAASASGKIVSVSSLDFEEYQIVQYDGYQYYITLNNPLYYLSPNISLNISVIKASDGYELWDNSGSYVLGNNLTLVLSGINNPQNGDYVVVNYSFTINDLSSLVIDYNKGDFYIDYTYLADEIVISYEYGDNVLDFRNSSALNPNEDYYVSYKVGALRDALLKNFGLLIDIPILSTFDTLFDRERYRDCLIAAMQSFISGPSLTAIKNIASIISHTPAEVKESAFTNWSLGYNLLSQEEIITSGDLNLLPSKYGSGVLIKNSDEYIKLPIAGNLKIEEGTFESWIIPEWNGLDNLADLTISILKNGVPLPENQIFIGAAEYHPSYVVENNKYVIKLNKNDRVDGTPNKYKDGVFIYYDKDLSGDFSRWYLAIQDGYDDGYIVKNYDITIETNGKFYDSKFTSVSKPYSGSLFTSVSKINYKITNDINPQQEITFLADTTHYILDYAENENKNRISLFKDETGYLNFKIFDSNKTSYLISSDISAWKAGEKHFVATSWKLNAKTGRDEIHLFVDGQEVPNIFKYGEKLKPYLHEKYRTINPEQIIGFINNNIVSSTDLSTTFGSNIVNSSINFGAYGINIGDTLYIEEEGFSTTGYNITFVNGNNLTLASVMPLTIQNGKFSVNKTSFSVKTPIDIYPNIAVSLLHTSLTNNDLQGTIGASIVYSSSSNFISSKINPGYLIKIDGLSDVYTILSVSANSLIINDTLPSSFSGTNFYIYKNEDEEIPGVRALHPAYEISESTDGYYNAVLTIRDKALINDIVLINTLGINNRRLKQKYYIWGNNANVIPTRLPPPVSLNDVKIYKVLLDRTAIGPSNSTLSFGVFNSNNLKTDQPSNTDSGRFLTVEINGTNIDFSTSVSVNIDGIRLNPISGLQENVIETLTFTDVGSLNTSNLFLLVNTVQVNCKPIDTSKDCLLLAVKEANAITYKDINTAYLADGYEIVSPVIRFSYQVSVGNTLYNDGSDGYVVRDENAHFSDTLIGNYLRIISPSAVAGFYNITGVSSDRMSLTLSQLSSSYPLPLTTFTDGVYEVLNLHTYSSGLQNGFFTFEEDRFAGIPYILTKGMYEFDYYTYLTIPFKSNIPYFYLGSSYDEKNQLGGILDEVRISSAMYSDVRIGEVVSSSKETITKHYNSVKPPKLTSNLIFYSTFDEKPFVNKADFYITSNHQYIQASEKVNDKFNQSICFTNAPLKFENLGILNKNEGTIEFWINTLFDSWNDIAYRFYFDASSVVSEKTTSVNNVEVKIKGRASKIVSVKLLYGDKDYDYFINGTISSDKQTIYLRKPLPSPNTPVIVSYEPTGTNGDRISIYKDPSGYINFNIRADSLDYQIRAPIFWTRNSWHRVKASYKVNGGLGKDEIRLFVDGYERGNVLFGSGLLLGQGVVMGSSYVGESSIISSITFKDTINEFYIGTDHSGKNGAFALIDNLRISNVSRPLYMPYGESLDVNYSSNTEIVLPVVEDLYTTLLLDFDKVIEKVEDFAKLRNDEIGLFDFTITVFDSFKLISQNDKLQEILEILVKKLKPANSRSFIIYK